MLSLTLFGHFQAILDSEPISLPTKSASALLAYLILEQQPPQPRAHIATLLWPDSTDSQGRRNLRQTLLRLNKTFPDSADGQALILTGNSTLQWNPAYPVQIDVHQFEQCLAIAEPFLHTSVTATPYPALAPLKTALELYQGDLLLGFDLISDYYANWLVEWRVKLQRQALTGWTRLADCYGRAGQPKRMEKMARQQLAIAPEREEAHQQLIQAYLAQGEHKGALIQYNTYQRHLEEIGLPRAKKLQQLQQLALSLRQGEATHPSQPPHNIPPEEAPFYGRQEELDDLLLWLVTPDQRLLTLTGLGGIGKTRLALAASRHFIRSWIAIPQHFAGGVWFVSLVEVENNDETMVAEAILQSCGWRTQREETAMAAIIRCLSNLPQLLILDNLEHLPCMTDFVLQLLTAVPTLTILATSRHRLGLQREVVRHLHGLPVPQDETDLAVPSIAVPSIALLNERLQRLNSDFKLTPDVTPCLVTISRNLEGWPLALELAAGWIEVMDIAEITTRVTNNITTLHTTLPDLPPRHRSIEAALTGSYALLTVTEQRSLARFAIFHGGCTGEAATRVLDTTTERIMLLVRRALLQEQEGRYTIHEMVRQFAAHKLTQIADKVAAEEAHATYYLDLLLALKSELYGPNPITAVHQLRPERENIYQAWRWAIATDQHEMLVAALPSLFRFFNIAGLLREGVALLSETQTAVTQPPFTYDFLFAHVDLCTRLGEYDTARDALKTLPDLQSLSPAHQMKAHLRQAKLYTMQNYIQESLPHYQQALELGRKLGDHDAIIISLTQLGIAHDYDPVYEAEISAMLGSVQDRWLQRFIYSYWGALSIRHSDYRKTVSNWKKALEISLELEDWYASGSYHNNLGDAFRELGDFAAAEASFQQAIDLSEMIHDEVGRLHALEGWARLCILRGDYDQAIPLAQESIDLAVAYGKQTVQMAALACLGHAYVGLQLWVQAEKAYARAAELLPTLPHLAMESKVGLAYVHWQLGDLTAARTHINQFLALLANASIEGFASPGLNYERAAQILAALGEAKKADEMLARIPGTRRQGVSPN